MTEFFRDAYDFSQIFKITYLGKLYKLNNTTGFWDDVTEVIDFSNEWDKVPFFLVNAYCLKLYSTLSASYFYKHKEEFGINNYDFGTHFDYYFINKKVCAVDEKQDLYICNPDFMIPQLKKINSIPEKWQKLEYTEAFDIIKNQNSIFIADMELYFDKNGNIQGFTKDLKQFCLNLTTGQLNEVYDDIGIDPDWKECKLDNPIFTKGNLELMLSLEDYKSLSELHDYILKSESEYNKIVQKHPFGKDFTYFIDPYGRVIAEDENKNYYNCDYDFMKPTYNRDSVSDSYEILRYDVITQIRDYERYKEALPTIHASLIHTINLVSNDKDELIYSRDQKGTWYILNKYTAELIPIDEEPSIGDDWVVLNKVQSLKLQGICNSQKKV